MYKLMSVKSRIWYVLDTQTMTPALLSLRYTEDLLQYRAFNTQRYELNAVVKFYCYWYEKFNETLDYFLYKSNFQNIEPCLHPYTSEVF